MNTLITSSTDLEASTREGGAFGLAPLSMYKSEMFARMTFAAVWVFSMFMLSACSEDAVPVRDAPPYNQLMAPPEDQGDIEASPVQVAPREAFDWHRVTHDKTAPRKSYSRKEQSRTREVIEATARRVGASDDARALLLLIAMRESSWRGNQHPFDERGIIHRLSPDKESASSAWKRQEKRYEGNPAYERSVDWMSYGPYGHNSPLFLHQWDRMGDPHMLGDTVIATLTELRVMRSKLHSLQGSALCPVYTNEGGIKTDWKGRKWRVGVQAKDANGKVIKRRIKLSPTWANLHRAVQGGKLCPAWEHDERAQWYEQRFRARAAKWGLNPDAIVTRKDLGSEPAGDQYALWASIWESLGDDVLDGASRDRYGEGASLLAM